MSTIGEFNLFSTNTERFPFGSIFRMRGIIGRFVNGYPASPMYILPLSSNVILSGAVKFQTTGSIV